MTNRSTWNRRPGEPLTSSMDNVFAMKIGIAAREVVTEPHGDAIDQGLNMLRKLNAFGIDLVPRDDA
ncbi:MAG: hypothetical protein RLW87_06945 [Alphaproteobacteria bacterium]